MSELKTLNNMKHYKRKGLLEGINEKELRREAIKRYKSNLERIQYTKDDREMILLEGKNQEIEEFYNLTEEDLKERKG